MRRCCRRARGLVRRLYRARGCRTTRGQRQRRFCAGPSAAPVTRTWMDGTSARSKASSPRPAMTASAEKSTRRNCHGRTTPSPSCPALCRASTSLLAEKNVDGRDGGAKQSFVASPGHDGECGKIDAKIHGHTTPSLSCPALCRASTSLLAEKNVDGRDKPGHDGECGRIDAKKLSRTHHSITVLPGLVPGIHVLAGREERGWPGQARP